MLTTYTPPKTKRRTNRIRSYTDRCSACRAMTSHDMETGKCLVCEAAALRKKLDESRA